jgi:S1-C subfamily serine protease
MRAWSILALAAACSGNPKNPEGPKKPLTPKDIAQQSSAAVVAVEVGHGDRAGSGTGFILDKSGLIATNFHVIRGNKDIRVKLYGGEMYQVTEIAGVDRERDLALIRIAPAKALPTVRLGDSDKMTAGDTVVAIGNPLGVFEHTVSSGLISQVRPVCTVQMVQLHLQNRARFEALAAKPRRTDAEETELQNLSCSQELTLLQISAPISQGSSGGPLFNQAGEVVGVTTLIVTQGQNINLAIPGNYLKPIVAKPAAISLDEFEKKTRSEPEDDSQTKVPRVIPDHPLAVFDGCSRDNIADLVSNIWQAIEVGAPIYNKALNPQNSDQEKKTFYEACFRIYEGASNKLEGVMPCKGVKQAFTDGLKRAGTLGDDYRLKAWAMRDTFDGLLKAAEKWAAANGGGQIKPKK